MNLGSPNPHIPTGDLTATRQLIVPLAVVLVHGVLSGEIEAGRETATDLFLDIVPVLSNNSIGAPIEPLLTEGIYFARRKPCGPQ
jgi:hypothetical protein